MLMANDIVGRPHVAVSEHGATVDSQCRRDPDHGVKGHNPEPEPRPSPAIDEVLVCLSKGHVGINRL